MAATASLSLSSSGITLSPLKASLPLPKKHPRLKATLPLPQKYLGPHLQQSRRHIPLSRLCHGDDEFCTSGSLCSMDSSLLFPVGSHVADFYCPPHKRARISSPYVLMFEEEKMPSIEVLPDECLFEIFRRLPGGQERSSAACVSKHWLMLLSSVNNSEIIAKKSVEEDTLMVTNEDEVDGFLTRCVEGKKASDIRLAAIAVGTATRGGLGKLLVCGNNRVTDIGLSAIASGCPSLKTLSLWNVPFLGDEGLIEIAKECHLLEKLDLSHCPLNSNHGVIDLCCAYFSCSIASWTWYLIISLLLQVTSISWKEHELSMVDTPGHANFGGEYFLKTRTCKYGSTCLELV